MFPKILERKSHYAMLDKILNLKLKDSHSVLELEQPLSVNHAESIYLILDT